MKAEPAYIVTIGASAGGFTALCELVATLDPGADAAYFAVLHLSTQGISGYLAHRLQQFTSLSCLVAADGLPIRRGHVYVAVPNKHLMMENGLVRLSSGPLENRWRPSIDVLFRAAAASYTNRVIGVVLTGLLNDGTTGMSGIKRTGGTTIVQDPNEAEYPDMPLSVLKVMEVDHCVSLHQIGPLIAEICNRPLSGARVPPEDLVVETEVLRNMQTSIGPAEKIGVITHFTCPECGGVLYLHHQDAISKFKCHVGHSFTARDLLIKQSEEVENSLWYAVRSLEQRKNLLESLVNRYEQTGNTRMANDYLKRIDEIEGHLVNLKTVISATQDHPDEEE